MGEYRKEGIANTRGHMEMGGGGGPGLAHGLDCQPTAKKTKTMSNIKDVIVVKNKDFVVNGVNCRVFQSLPVNTEERNCNL